MMEADFGLLNNFGTISQDFGTKIQQNGPLATQEIAYGPAEMRFGGAETVQKGEIGGGFEAQGLGAQPRL